MTSQRTSGHVCQQQSTIVHQQEEQVHKAVSTIITGGQQSILEKIFHKIKIAVIRTKL